MGTINYTPSNYITLAIKPYNYNDFANDPDFLNEVREYFPEYMNNIEDYIYSYIQSCYECDYDNISSELAKHYFKYFNIKIKEGYYEGFMLDIENNYPVCFDDYSDKLAAQKEITEIKEFLNTCAGYGMVMCSPWWYTSYGNYQSTLQNIKAAIKEMRNEVHNTPTWEQYSKSEYTPHYYYRWIIKSDNIQISREYEKRVQAEIDLTDYAKIYDNCKVAKRRFAWYE